MSKIALIIAFVLCLLENTQGQADSLFFNKAKVRLQSFLDTADLSNIKFDSSDFKRPYKLHPSGWVNDFERILMPREIFILDSIIDNFEKETTIEIAVVTVDSFYTDKDNFDSAITNLGRTWGVGKRNKNNGIVIGISTELRRIRISNGYGIESKISDTDTKTIIDKVIIPEFRQANYFVGIKNGLLALMDKLR